MLENNKTESIRTLPDVLRTELTISEDTKIDASDFWIETKSGMKFLVISKYNPKSLQLFQNSGVRLSARILGTESFTADAFKLAVADKLINAIPVSYTHLTLPTILLV